MVDGVLASCYASANHDLAHIAMTPVRLFPEIVEMIFGNENESPVYVNIITNCGKNLLPYGNVNGLN